MTIDKSDGGWWVNCDQCPEVHDLHAEDLGEAIDEVREAGWYPYKDELSGKWEHACPSCQEEWVV